MTNRKNKSISSVTQISKRAKQIRKKGEKWTDAIKRASKELKSKTPLHGKPYKIDHKPQLVTGELSGLKGQFKANLIPEISIRYTKGKRILGTVKSSKDASVFIKKQYKRGSIELQEYFNVIYLDHKNSILGYYQHSKGSLTATIADGRIIFGIALKSLASAMILSHNHPSGTLTPSQADINLTKKMRKLGDLHDIKVLDHIIVTKQDYYSFADKGML